MKRAILLSLYILLLPSWVMASDTCPTPSDSTDRRVLAKAWFGKGEEASRDGNHLAAITAFQCSLSLIPHGFTAFNLARLAEQVGDLELAISSYERYLNLMPGADDVDAIRAKVGALRDRLAQARQSVSREVDTLLAHESPPVSEPVPQEQEAPSSKPSEVERSNAPAGFSATTWVLMGVGIATIGTGIVFNVQASRKMDTSDNRYLDGDLPGAESAHDSAKRFAYVSYGLMSAGVLATAVGLTLGILPHFEHDVAIGVLPGGLALSLGGRFQ